MNKTAIFAWAVTAVGTILWVYGYFATGAPSVINWRAHTPVWIADFLPNLESEVGMVLMCVGTVLVYWPPRR